MGNQQIIDLVLRVGYEAVSPLNLKTINPSDYESSLIYLYEKQSRNFNFYVSTKGREIRKESFKITSEDFDVAFVLDPTKLDVEAYKRGLKTTFTKAISLIEFSNDFQSFLEKNKSKVSSSVELVNLINNSIEENITPEFLIKYVLKPEIDISTSSIYLNFVNADRYLSGLAFYARRNFQSLYVANTITTLLQLLEKDSKISFFVGYAEQSITNITNGDYQAIAIGILVVVIGLVLGGILIYFVLSHYISHMKEHSKIVGDIVGSSNNYYENLRRIVQA